MEVLNRRAHYDYSIIDDFEAGMILTGSEIKSLRRGDANITEAFIYINKNEVFIKNMYISKFDKASYLNHEERRDRKLLLNKSEVEKIEKYLQNKGTAIVPMKIFFQRRWAKLKIGIGTGKKTYDKRESIKERETKKEISKVLKNM